MKQQGMILDKRSEIAQYFYLEQGRVKQTDVPPTDKRRGRQTYVLLPAEKTEARLLRLPMADAKSTAQMLEMALEHNGTTPNYRWQIVQQRDGWQWIFCLVDTERTMLVEGKARQNLAAFLTIYDALLTAGRALGDTLASAAVLFYWTKGQLTLLFLREGQPVHGQTINDVITAEDIADAYQRTAAALVRQGGWQETQAVYGLWERGSERLLAQQLAVLLTDRLVILNDQMPFASWDEEDAPLLVRLLLENEVMSDKHGSGRKEPGKTKQKLMFCAALVILMGLAWSGSTLMAERAQQPMLDAPPNERVPMNDTVYGEFLDRLAAKQGDATFCEIRSIDKGLEIYAEAATWQAAAALGERLQTLDEISHLIIVRAERSQRLQDKVPISLIAMTIRIEWEGGGADER